MKKNKALKWEIKDVIAAALLSLFLVSFTVLCCNWYDMRSNLVERLF